MEIEEADPVNQQETFNQNHNLQNPIQGHNINPKRKRKENPYKQCYKVEWKFDPKRSHWLRGVPHNPHLAQCTVCPDKKFMAKLSTIDYHDDKCRKHQENMQALRPVDVEADENAETPDTLKEDIAVVKLF